ncbi:uncharacterized protein LOC122319747 [Drosophila ficusphila]|uniref:uncharacterized protein LOC122319747 n=1 Tax=Drosophila ficusphila TaxID=30025 RepID=UPI001C8A7663|nr:uncharacterized protein LOC122319747 [Drosophila ficusphila]
MNDNRHLTSEVGSAPPKEDSSSTYRAALEEQNRNLMEIIKSMQAPRAPAMDGRALHVTLPKFCPDTAGADASAWCTTVDLIFADNALEGSALVIALSKALEGNASQWLSQICFAGITWPQFKELFIQRFVGIETTSAILMNILNGRPKTGESFAEYGSRIVTLLLSKWKAKNLEEIAVSVALAHMAQIDNNLLRWLFTTNVTTRNELQQQLQAYAFKKRNNVEDDYSTGPDKKRTRMQSQVECHFCGKAGHKMVDCRFRKQQNQFATDKSRPGKLDGYRREKSNVTCYTCGELGHISTQCTKKEVDKNKGFNREKRVEQCSVAVPKGCLNHRGQIFEITFDSGSECSLMKEKLSTKFSGKKNK